MMDNLEGVLQSLNEFDNKTADKDLSPELEQLLEHIAKTGKTVFPWSLLKPLICFKLEKVLNEFFESGIASNAYTSEPTTKSQEFLPEVEKLVNNLNCFSGPPFTIQRICELITQPRKHYKTTDKFLRGVEKNILVVSTVQPDGSLITRSLGPPLTNGTVSPTETIPINSMPSPSKPAHNSPLNTNFQENGLITNAQPSDEPTEETEQTSTQDDFDNNLEPSKNGHENETHCAQENDQESLEVLKKDVASDEKENVECNIDSNLQADKNTTVEENPAEENDEERNKVEDEEKPAVEATEKSEEEKMDES